MNDTFVFNPIGMVRSCFSEKFGIPRQPRLAPAARATMEIFPPYDQDEAFGGLEAFSHLWLVFVFHGIPKGCWRPTVRPPRLGGNRRTGVFATRSGFRPNPIGMSAVVLEEIHRHQGRLLLELSGIDLLDRTPVLDVKPYLPYSDIIPEATGGFAAAPPRPWPSIEYTDRARQACALLESTYPGFVDLLNQVLGADPRPAYMDGHARTEFGVRLHGVNVRWTHRQDTIVVHTIEVPADPPALPEGV
ncbi:tRNA (N6-threonylcarbamoyladenosine(37)-N6)-methyltransferase TrmO [Desulfosarcina alkanivorans]|uniref:tRNA (N6-threonylcarbamoyladenosine(37)-N6)-methyltransferase TrmO n=1 Tax=Desulfosarcina alkanivorans TaxID=571177 RepID=A0A5K7YQC8_9BACT|nr:tRNA (N6-threonylcarbamoyladenosine(37)-N6)-methyltransferase TrmO [Desulfosarcina alkanivorans]BBO70570.1 tRNA (N6-threonylcarbamoyladenosine(37)-N6)-methyltransferase TrmO [Desulfosarcina alkanivorans]